MDNRDRTEIRVTHLGLMHPEQSAELSPALATVPLHILHLGGFALAEDREVTVVVVITRTMLDEFVQEYVAKVLTPPKAEQH